MENVLFDLVKKDSDYHLYQGDSPLQTRGGKIMAHHEQRLLKQIITDFELTGTGGKQNISAYKLLEFQIDFIDSSKDLILDNFASIVASDEFILLKTGKKVMAAGSVSPREIPEEELSIMNTLFWGASSVIMNLNRFIAGNIQHIESDEETEHPFLLILRQHYLHFRPEQKSAVHFLCWLHGSGIVLPLLLVLNRITASEYAKGILSVAGKQKSAMIEGTVHKDAGFPFQSSISPGDPPHKVYECCLNDCYAVLDYLNYFTVSEDSKPMVGEFRKKGESSELEYKSTLRWDLKAGKPNNAVERASLKTIAGFLNSSGGILLIGVRDDGSVEGIESDRFPNDDRFLLHLWTLVRTSLGRDVSPYIQTILEKAGEKTVCIVKCSRSPRPVFLRQPGFDEDFYIRAGPSSNALDISEALRYISTHY